MGCWQLKLNPATCFFTVRLSSSLSNEEINRWRIVVNDNSSIIPTNRRNRVPTTWSTLSATSGCSMQYAWKSRREMNATSASSIATAEAGKGPPSKTGNSATDSPGTLTARTCSRPFGDVLKMRTLPCAMMCSPLHGSPSEKSNSPEVKSLRTVRADSVFNSAAVRLDKSAVLPRAAARSVRSAVTREF